mmetsp:Transcript_25129/g.82424  ORF Transcript_25129/g.82424 Transcript_25129/m.82424 type:complete len:249 (+) Transcript_25129:327-1073(+)
MPAAVRPVPRWSVDHRIGEEARDRWGVRAVTPARAQQVVAHAEAVDAGGLAVDHRVIVALVQARERADRPAEPAGQPVGLTAAEAARAAARAWVVRRRHADLGGRCEREGGVYLVHDGARPVASREDRLRQPVVVAVGVDRQQVQLRLRREPVLAEEADDVGDVDHLLLQVDRGFAVAAVHHQPAPPMRLAQVPRVRLPPAHHAKLDVVLRPGADEAEEVLEHAVLAVLAVDAALGRLEPRQPREQPH